MRQSNVDHELDYLRSEMGGIKELLSTLVSQNNTNPTSSMKNKSVNNFEDPNPMRQSLAVSHYKNPNFNGSPSRMRNSSYKNDEVNAIHGEIDQLEHAKKDLQNRLKLVDELDNRYKSKLETTMRDDFANNVTEVYQQRQEMQFDKMSKLIADLDGDNHRLRKEFELYKEKSDNKKSVDDARTMLTDMKIEKLLVQFEEKYNENPAFHDTFQDNEMMEAMWKEKNMREMISNLLTFTLHTSFVKKPAAKKDGAKKTGR